MKVISVENLSKSYHLGQIGTGTFANDLKLWWAKARGKPNPLIRIGETDHGNRDGEDLWALRDVSFNVEQGEVLGIIGRNGAGKSTLLKILSRITAPTSGSLKVKGRIASLLEVGTGFHPELTGRENVYLNGAILGMNRREIDRKFDEIVDFAGVEKFIDTPVKRYSSGMYVRLAFAVAAHLDPEILLVDEVLAVGDAEFQRKCLGKMGEVAQGGRTVLFVSHNMGAIQSLCKNAIVLNGGSIFCQDDVGVAVSRYVSLSEILNNVKLSERTDHSGNGRVRIADVYIVDDKGNKKNSLTPNERVSFVFVVENNDRILNGITVMATVYDNTRSALAYFSNELTGSLIELVNGHTQIHCSIPNLPFRPGVYSINIGVKKGFEVLDHLHSAIELELIDNNYFSTGKLLYSSIAPILIPQTWCVVGNS